MPYDAIAATCQRTYVAAFLSRRYGCHYLCLYHYFHFAIRIDAAAAAMTLPPLIDVYAMSPRHDYDAAADDFR